MAFGTSTPTSITVVATRSLASPRANRSIAASLSSGLSWPWTSTDRVPEARLERGEARLGGGEVLGLAFAAADHRADPVGLVAALEMAREAVDHVGEPVERDHAGVDRLAPGRHLVELRHVHLAELRKLSACAGSGWRSWRGSAASPGPSASAAGAG